jgi:hypothetical protein
MSIDPGCKFSEFEVEILVTGISFKQEGSGS